MKKIAIFQSNLNIGGIQRALLNLLNIIDYQKFEIDLYLIEKNNILLNELNNNVNVCYFKKNPRFYNFLPFFIQNKLYKNNIKKKYDLAINYNTHNIDTALKCLNINATKKICWIHSNLHAMKNGSIKSSLKFFFAKEKYKYFDEIIYVSKGCREALSEKIIPKRKKSHIIPNFIDTNLIDEKTKEQHSVSIDKNILNIVTVARLVEGKKIDHLIKIVKELLKYRKDFHLYIIGDGPERKKLEKITNKYKLNNKISFLGYKKNPYAIMKDMDAFVLLSRHEGQGIVFLEAAYLGLDIIMPKHLEDFVGINIKGSDNILRSLMNLKKKKKKEKYNLDNYNKEIIDKFNNLLIELEV